VAQLRTLLETEFPEVEARLQKGLPPLGYYEAEGEAPYPICADPANAPWTAVGEHSFRATFDKENVYLDIRGPRDTEILFRFEGRLFHPVCEIWIKEGKLCLDPDTVLYRPLVGRAQEEAELAQYCLTETEQGFRITANRAHILWTEDSRPFKLLLKIGDHHWHEEADPVYNLGQGTTSAGEYGWMKAT